MTKNIEQINQSFKKIGEVVISWRWGILSALLVLTMVSFMGLKDLRLENTNESWFMEDDPLVIATDEFKEIFGTDSYVAILVEAEDVFAPDTLRVIRDLGEELLDQVPYADDLQTITNFEFTRGTEEGIEVINLVPDEIPDNPEAIEEIRQMAFSKHFQVNRLFSDDSKEAWMILYLQDYEDDQQPGQPEPYVPIAQKVEEILSQEKYQNRGCSFKTAGRPINDYENKVFSTAESARVTRLTMLISLIFLTIFMRSIRGILAPGLISIAALIWVFGAMGWLGIVVDPLMIPLPVFICQGLSIGYSIHLFNCFKRHFYLTGKRHGAVVHAVEQTGWPILFTAFTTIGALLSFAVVKVATVRWMGFACAATVAVVYLLVMTLIPIMFSFGRNREPHPDDVERGGTRLEHFFLRFSEWILAHATPIMIVFGVAVVVLLTGLPGISVNMDYTHTIGLQVPHIKRFHEISNSTVGAFGAYNFTLQFEEENRGKSPEILQKLDLLEMEIQQFPLVKRTSSLLETVKDLNQVMHEDDPAYYRIPDDQELISQLLLLYEMSAGTEHERWTDYTYTTLRMRVEITDFDAGEIEREFKILEQRTAELFPEATFGMVGNAIQFSVVHDYVAKGQISSFLIALCVIGVLMMLVFQSVTTGLIGMIPNLAPVIVIGGIMGYSDIPLDMGTMLVMPLVLGLAVDDTIHFITHSKLEFQRSGNYRTAVRDTFRIVGKSLFMTSSILVLAFCADLTSTINYYVYIGMLAIAGISSALLADYFVTPVLILWTKPFGKGKESQSPFIQLTKGAMLKTFKVERE